MARAACHLRLVFAWWLSRDDVAAVPACLRLADCRIWLVLDLFRERKGSFCRSYHDLAVFNHWTCDTTPDDGLSPSHPRIVPITPWPDPRFAAFLLPSASVCSLGERARFLLPWAFHCRSYPCQFFLSAPGRTDRIFRVESR